VRNWRIIGIIALAVSCVVSYPTFADLTKDPKLGASQRLPKPDNDVKANLAGHISIPDAPTLRSFDDRMQVAQAPPLSNRCVTQVVVCILPGYAPVGLACWCATPYGPAAGVVR
jgi:hypothetical protein